MSNFTHKDRITTAARKILSGQYLTEFKSYGKDSKVQRAMDIIQELEPGEQFSDLLSALTEWATTAYGDLQNLRGPDTPLGSQTNLRSWKEMARTFDRLSELEWGDDPEEEEEPMAEPSDETEPQI